MSDTSPFAEAGQASGLFAGETAALALRHMSRRFGSLVALDDITLNVPLGGRHAILGANGAGKTTLFNCVTGDVHPTHGRITLFGTDVTGLASHHRIRLGLRRTYQTSQVFPSLSVLDNLYLAEQGVHPGRRSFARLLADNPLRQRARDLAAFVDLAHWLHTPAQALSHGQKRQLEIAMALAGQPRLILFDEPAAGLSKSERQRLTDILLALPQAITFIIIEHDLEVALRVADRVTVLHQGAWFAAGTPAEIEANEAVQRIYLGRADG